MGRGIRDGRIKLRPKTIGLQIFMLTCSAVSCAAPSSFPAAYSPATPNAFWSFRPGESVAPIESFPAVEIRQSAVSDHAYLLKEETENMSRVFAAILAITVITSMQAGTVLGEQLNDKDIGKKAVDLASDAANRICGQIPTGGELLNGNASAQVRAQIPAFLKRLGLQAQVEGGIAATGGAYSGPAQADLPQVLHDDLACRESVATLLLDSARRAAEPSQPVEFKSTSSAKASAEAIGSVLQNQTVTVANQPVPFTMRPDGWGGFSVTPDVSKSGIADEWRGTDYQHVELALGLPLHLTTNYQITFLASGQIDGHLQLLFQSPEIWGGHTVKWPPASSGEVTNAVILPANGEPQYAYIGGKTYYLTAGTPRDPGDGSPVRVMLNISQKEKAN